MQSNDLDNKNSANLSVSKLRKRYTFALSIIALLIVLSQIIMQFLLTSQIYDSHIVNIAGRQRMLSQKITKLSYYISTAESDNAILHYQSDLKNAADLWKKSHLGLIHGSEELGLPGTNSKEIITLFNKIQPHYIAIHNAATAISLSTDINKIKQNTQSISQHEAEFLEYMNEIVFQYDQEANTKVTNTKWLEISLMISTLLVLVLEAVFIFSPAARSIQNSMQKLTKREEDLQNLFAASPIAMLLINSKDFSVIQANKKAQTLISDHFDSFSTITLQTYIDTDYECNKLFISKLKKGKNLNENEIVILNAQGVLFETLASVRAITFNNETVLVVGITNISELKKAQQKLEHYASFDEMTGLLNRRTGLVFLNKSMKRLDNHDGQLSICYIDLDGLKYINDHYGHSEGDWFIRTVSKALTDTIRSNDAGVRLGGDEFLLILHNCPIENANNLIRRIETHLLEIKTAESKPFPINFSYGLTIYTSDRDITPDELISESDDLMYQLKHSKKQKIAKEKSISHEM